MSDREPHLGDEIRNARQYKRMSQSKLAKLTGMPQPSLSRIESSGSVSIQTLRKIATALDMGLLIRFIYISKDKSD